MEKTAQQTDPRKILKISAKQENAIKVSQLAEKIKGQWEELAKRQENSGVKTRANRKITSITMTRDKQGKIAVQVNLRSGRSITDNGQEKALDTFKQNSHRSVARAKIEELLKKIRENGFAAVEGEIPAELREAVLKAMEKANISTSYRGAKAEAAAAKQASINAARAADNAMKGVVSGFAAGASMDRTAKRVGSELFAAAGKGEHAYSIHITPAIEKALGKGVSFVLPPVRKDYPEEILPQIRESVGKTMDIAARVTENIPDVSELKGNRIGSSGVTMTTADGTRTKASPNDLDVKHNVQLAYREAFERMTQGKGTRNDEILLTEYLQPVLKHNGIISKPISECDEAERKKVENFIKTCSDLKEKGAVQYFSPERQQIHKQAKAHAEELKHETAELDQKNREISANIAEKETLISKVLKGEADFSNCNHQQVSDDMRAHKKGGYTPTEEEKFMLQVLHLERVNNGLNNDAPLSQETIKKGKLLYIDYTALKTEHPNLAMHDYLTSNIRSFEQKEETKHLSTENEASRVSGKLQIMSEKAAKQQKTAQQQPKETAPAQRSAPSRPKASAPLQKTPAPQQKSVAPKINPALQMEILKRRKNLGR